MKTIDIPADVMRAYLKWLRNPRGASFGFCVITRSGVVDVTLPLVRVKHG